MKTFLTVLCVSVFLCAQVALKAIPTLHFLALSGDIVGISALMRENPDIDFNKQDELGNTPLHYAVESGNSVAVTFFVHTLPQDYGKKILTNIRNSAGHTPHSLAVQRYNEKKDTRFRLILDRLESVHRARHVTWANQSTRIIQIRPAGLTQLTQPPVLGAPRIFVPRVLEVRPADRRNCFARNPRDVGAALCAVLLVGVVVLIVVSRNGV